MSRAVKLSCGAFTLDVRQGVVFPGHPVSKKDSRLRANNAPAQTSLVHFYVMSIIARYNIFNKLFSV